MEVVFCAHVPQIRTIDLQTNIFELAHKSPVWVGRPRAHYLRNFSKSPTPNFVIQGTTAAVPFPAPTVPRDLSTTAAVFLVPA